MSTLIEDEIVDPDIALWSYSKLRKKFPKLAKISKKLESQQILKPYKRNLKHYHTIVAEDILSSIQIDLLDIHQLSRLNKGVKFLFCIIDVYSRYAFVFPLKSKSANETSKVFGDWLLEVESKYDKIVKNVNSDDGNEFKGEFIKILNDWNINHHVSVSIEKSVNFPTKQAIVERFIRTLRNLINKYTEYHGTKKYINALSKIVANYNNMPHSSLKNKKPIDIINGRKVIKDKERNINIPKQLPIGSHVRILLKKGIFEKGSKARWSKDVYIIKLMDKNGYILENTNTKEELKDKKYKWELQPIDKDVIKSEKKEEKEEKEILQKEKINKKISKEMKIDEKNMEEKKLQIGSIYTTKYNYDKSYQVIVLEVKKYKVKVISKDLQLDFDNKESKEEIQNIPISELITYKGKITKKNKMNKLTKEYLIKNKII